MLNKGDAFGLQQLVEGSRYREELRPIVKAAVTVGTPNAGNWAAPLAEYDQTVSAFLEGLANISAFQAMLPFMKRIPFRTRIAVTISVITGHSGIGAGEVKRVSSMALEGHVLDERKSAAIVTLTNEQIRLGDSVSDILRALQTAVATATDADVLDLLTTGISPVTSSGSTAANVLADIYAGLDALALHANSRVFVVTTPDVTKAWALRTNADGSLAFPMLSIGGGTLAGLTVIASDGVTAGEAVFIDATQIAANGGTVVLDRTRQAALQLDDTGDSPVTASTQLTPLWQLDLSALKVERVYGAERLRDTAVSVVSGLAYTGNSPS
jgi:hypothetical protein